MKKVFLIFVLLISLSSFMIVSGADSSSETNFNIAGCSLPEGGGILINTCSRRADVDGEYYCDDGKFLWETRSEGLGCSLGNDSYVLGDPFCCPPGMFCNDTGSFFRCDIRPEQCYDQMNEEDCENNGCIWLEEEGVCSDGTRDYACSIYQNAASCFEDFYNLGVTGVGTEFCGSYVECAGTSYTIPYDSCGCVWNSGSNACELYMEVSETYYSEEDLKKWFSCSRDYVIGECIEGKQDMNWTASSVLYNDFPEICLDAVGCSNGSDIRMCGEPVIKLPGFSLFSLFASLVIFCLYYNRRFER